MTLMQEEPESGINRALTMAAVDACAMLRKWSDSKVATGVDDTQITPHKIGLFQEELKQHFAAIYFGTHERLLEEFFRDLQATIKSHHAFQELFSVISKEDVVLRFGEFTWVDDGKRRVTINIDHQR